MEDGSDWELKKMAYSGSNAAVVRVDDGGECRHRHVLYNAVSNLKFLRIYQTFCP